MVKHKTNKCGACHYFHYAPLPIRTSKPCQELNVSKKDDSCPGFVPLDKSGFISEGIPRYPLELLDSKLNEDVKSGLGSLSKTTYRDMFKEIISEQFILNQDAYLSILEIGNILQQQGSNVVLEEADFNRYVGKITKLYMLHRLVLALGMGTYLEDIMRLEIESLFTKIESKKSTIVKSCVKDDSND